jgi:hypothetical protein
LLWLFLDVQTSEKIDLEKTSNIVELNQNKINALANCTVKITDISGRLILEKFLFKDEHFSFLEKGIYIITAKSDSKTQSYKIIN